MKLKEFLYPYPTNNMRYFFLTQVLLNLCFLSLYAQNIKVQTNKREEYENINIRASILLENTYNFHTLDELKYRSSKLNVLLDRKDWEKYFVKVCEKLIIHPFLEDSLRNSLIYRLYHYRKSKGKQPNYKLMLRRFNKNEKRMIAKTMVSRFEQLPPHAVSGVFIGFYKIEDTASEPKKAQRKYENSLYYEARSIYELGKYSVSYLYEFLNSNNNDILFLRFKRGRIYMKIRKKEIAAYLLMLILDNKPTYTPEFVFPGEKYKFDDTKINEKLKALKTRLLNTPQYQKWLQPQIIEYSPTFEWYYDKEGNPTRDASKIVERED